MKDEVTGQQEATDRRAKEVLTRPSTLISTNYRFGRFAGRSESFGPGARFLALRHVRVAPTMSRLPVHRDGGTASFGCIVHPLSVEARHSLRSAKEHTFFGPTKLKDMQRIGRIELCIELRTCRSGVQAVCMQSNVARVGIGHPAIEVLVICTLQGTATTFHSFVLR
jgi:hypothetical protein